MTLVTDETMTPETETVKYYVGDLCYVIEDDVWGEVCELSFDPLNDAGDLLELADGRQFFIMNTAYGDGFYSDAEGRTYGVDSGTIGAIKVADIVEYVKMADIIERGLGQIIEFPYELEQGDVFYDDGTLCFGDVQIVTGGSDEEEEVEEEEEEEEEDA